MRRLSFDLSGAQMNGSAAKGQTCGFKMLFRKKTLRTDLWMWRHRQNRLTTHCHSHIFQLFPFYDPRTSKTSIFFQRQIKFQRIVFCAVLRFLLLLLRTTYIHSAIDRTDTFLWGDAIILPWWILHRTMQCARKTNRWISSHPSETFSSEKFFGRRTKSRRKRQFIGWLTIKSPQAVTSGKSYFRFS